MTFEITATYAAVLAVMMLILWVHVTKYRASTGISINHADDMDLATRIRRHGNFTEIVPMVLILMALSEAQGTRPLFLHLAGGLLILGRALHPFGLDPNDAARPLRIIGNSAGLIALVICVATILMARLA